MSAFSEYLNCIKDQRRLNGAEMARICGVNAAVVFKWLKGEHLPKSWMIMEELGDSLHLTMQEKKQLQSAYERTVLGEEKYNSYQKIIDLLKKLQERGRECREQYHNDYIKVHIKELPEFVELHSRMQIMQSIQDALIYLSTKEDRKLYLKVTPFHEDVILLLRMFLNRMDSCALEEIVCFRKKEYEALCYNLELVNGLVDLFTARHPSKIYVQDATGTPDGIFDNWVIADDFLIEFADDFSCGMLTSDPVWIAYFRSVYENMKSSGRCLSSRYVAACRVQGMESEEVPEFTGCITYMPCAEKDGSLQMTGVFFYLEGLVEFLETGKCPADTEGSVLDKESRLRVVYRMAYSCRSNMTGHMIREGRLPVLRDLCIECQEWEEGCLSIEIRFGGDRKERIYLYDDYIRKEIVKFFRFLGDSAYVYSHGETVDKIMEVAENYRRKWRL